MIFRTYNSLDDITVKVFYAILGTENYHLLFKRSLARKVCKKIKYLRVFTAKKWQSIYDDFAEATKTKESSNYFILLNEIGQLQTRYVIVYALLETLNESNKKEIGKELSAWGFMFNPKGTVKAQMESLLRQLRASQNKIKRKQGELESLESSMSKEKTNILKEKFQIEHITGVSVDINKENMSAWLELRKMAKEIIEAKKKSMKGNGE